MSSYHRAQHDYKAHRRIVREGFSYIQLGGMLISDMMELGLSFVEVGPGVVIDWQDIFEYFTME